MEPSNVTTPKFIPGCVPPSSNPWPLLQTAPALPLWSRQYILCQTQLFQSINSRSAEHGGRTFSHETHTKKKAGEPLVHVLYSYA